MSNNKYSSVEWLIRQYEIKGYIGLQDELQAKAMQQEQAQQYAEFCIRCDRESLPILDFNSWIAHNETFGGNNESN